MATSAQYQQNGNQALPPKKTRQRYRRETDDLDTATRESYVDPWAYNDYPPASPSANTAAARQSPRNSVPMSPETGPSASPALATASNDVSRTARQRPPSYETSTEQLSRGGYSGDRRRPQSSAQAQAYTTVQPPAAAPAGSRNMPAGSALLRQTQAQQSSSQPRTSQSQSYPQASQPVTGPSPPNQTPAQAAGASISRLKTPSVMDSVLQPLGIKVQEYDRLMHEAQDNMKRLDDELRALQLRRDEAETRFLDAEARHKEWQQQYDGVRRTLTGEAPAASQAPPMPQVKINDPLPNHNIQTNNIHDDDDDDDDEDDDDDNEPVYKRPWSMNHQSSFTSTKSKGRRSRLLSSIFGS